MESSSDHLQYEINTHSAPEIKTVCMKTVSLIWDKAFLEYLVSQNPFIYQHVCMLQVNVV